MWADPRTTRFIGGEPRTPDVSWNKFLGAAGLWPVMGYGYLVFADRADDRLVGMGGLAYFCRGIAEREGFTAAGWAFGADAWGAGLAAARKSVADGQRTAVRVYLGVHRQLKK